MATAATIAIIFMLLTFWIYGRYVRLGEQSHFIERQLSRVRKQRDAKKFFDYAAARDWLRRKNK